MDFFLSCGAIFCGVLMFYVVAYLLHGLPVECPSAARMDNRTVLITGKSVCLTSLDDALKIGTVLHRNIPLRYLVAGRSEAGRRPASSLLVR